MGAHYVAQAGMELLGSREPPEELALQVVPPPLAWELHFEARTRLMF